MAVIPKTCPELLLFCTRQIKSSESAWRLAVDNCVDVIEAQIEAHIPVEMRRLFPGVDVLAAMRGLHTIDILTMLRTLFFFGVLYYLSGAVFAATSIIQPDVPSSNPFEDVFPPLDVDNNNTDLNITASLDAYALRIACFKQPRPMIYGRVMTNEYYQAVDKILALDNAMTFKQWNLGSGRTTGWSAGKCVVGVRVPWPPVAEKFPPVMIAHAAAMIAKTCVNAANGYLGGWTQFGAGGQFAVNVGSRL